MRAIKIIITIALTATAIILLGMAAVLHNHTIIEWWKPVGVCILFAIPSGILMKGLMHKLMHFSRSVWNVIAGAVLWFGIFIGLFYSLNYFKSNETSAQERSVKVLSKYTEEHYHTKRVSRNTVTCGEKYKVYYINIELQNDHEKRIEIPAREYVKIKAGSRITLRIETGLFGIPVIKNLKFPVRQRNSHSPKRLDRRGADKAK